MLIGSGSRHSQRNVMGIHTEWILPPLHPLAVGLCPKSSVADFLRVRRGLRQGGVQSWPLGSHADFFSIFRKG